MDCRQLEWAGNWAEAIPLGERMLSLNPTSRKADDLRIWLGGILWKVGRMADSQSHLDAAHPTDPLLQAQKSYDQGELYYIQHGVMQILPDFEKALDAHHAALALRQEIDDKEGQTHSLSRLGVIHEHLAKPDEAKQYYTQSLRLAEEINYPHGKTRPLTHLGLFKLKEGDLDGAADYLRRALGINQKIGNVEREIWGHMNIGQLLLARDNDHPEVMDHFQRALSLSQQTGFKLALVVAHMRVGLLHQSLEQPEEATTHFASMRAIAADCDYVVFAEHADTLMTELQ